MFRPYKAIIRQQIYGEFYPICTLLQYLLFICLCYFLPRFYFVVRPLLYYVGVPLRSLSSLYSMLCYKQKGRGFDSDEVIGFFN
jgi:hypothetical protein